MTHASTRVACVAALALLALPLAGCGGGMWLASAQLESPISQGEKRVIVLIGFSDNTALGSGAATSETPIVSALRLDFGKLQDGRYYTSKMIEHLKTTALVPMPASSSPVVTALVVETEDEILALKALSSAFSSNRDSLESLIAGGKDK